MHQIILQGILYKRSLVYFMIREYTIIITWSPPLVHSILDCSQFRDRPIWLLAERRQCHRPTICFLISDLTNMWLQFWDKQACLAERTSALWATYFEQCVMNMKPTDKREMVKLHSYLSENPFECHVLDLELPFSEMPVWSINLKMTKHHLRRLRWCGRSRGGGDLGLALAGWSTNGSLACFVSTNQRAGEAREEWTALGG